MALKAKIYIVMLFSALQAQGSSLSEKITQCLQENVKQKKPIVVSSEGLKSTKFMEHVKELINVQPELACSVIVQGLLTLLEHTFIYQERIKLIVGRLANHQECTLPIILAVLQRYPQMFEDGNNPLHYNLDPLITVVQSLIKINPAKWQPILALLQDSGIQDAFDAQVQERLPNIKALNKELIKELQSTRNIDKVERLINTGASFWRWPLFSLIIERNNIDFLKNIFALSNKKYDNPQDLIMAFNLAIKKNNVEAMKLLLTRNNSLIINGIDGSLAEAIFYSNIDAARFLFEHGATLDPYRALYLALRRNPYKPEMTQLIFQYMPDLKIQSSEDSNKDLLYYAIDNRDSNAVKLLLEHGANPNVMYQGGGTPLTQAVREGNENTLRILVEYKAAVNFKDQFGQSPMGFAIGRGNIQAAYFLAQHGADLSSEINKQDHYGKTPLMEMTQENNADFVKFLLEYGANPNIENKGGETALQIALHNKRYVYDSLRRENEGWRDRQEKNAKIIELLKDYKAT